MEVSEKRGGMRRRGIHRNRLTSESVEGPRRCDQRFRVFPDR